MEPARAALGTCTSIPLPCALRWRPVAGRNCSLDLRMHFLCIYDQNSFHPIVSLLPENSPAHWAHGPGSRCPACLHGPGRRTTRSPGLQRPPRRRHRSGDRVPEQTSACMGSAVLHLDGEIVQHGIARSSLLPVRRGVSAIGAVVGGDAIWVVRALGSALFGKGETLRQYRLPQTTALPNAKAPPIQYDFCVSRINHCGVWVPRHGVAFGSKNHGAAVTP